jgi:hypothetical protein
MMPSPVRVAQFASEFSDRCASYSGTGEENDRLHAEFSRLAQTDPLLSTHRRHVEKNDLGFGDDAFHHLWKLLLCAASIRFGPFQAMEIGVYKGQVISLWSLLARVHHLDLRIHAITPLEGQPIPPPTLWRSIRARFDRRFKERINSGDFYALEDYETIVRAHFSRHGLDFDTINLLRGYSTAPDIRARAAGIVCHLLYIDGDHTYEGALSDVENYAPLVPQGGWLVMDDAAADQPGTTFWKGYPSVARACLRLSSLGFKNVLNIGHNRVFERVSK